jgi:hypothetical protein
VTALLRKAPAVGHLLAASAVSFGGLASAMTPAEAGMARYHWKNRPLIVFAPSGTDGRLGSQQGIVARHRNGLRERDMVVIMVAGDHVSSQLGPEPGARAGALRARYGVKASEFLALLIGKDGGVKISSRGPLSADRLFRTIDAMPMRRGEMHRRSGR